MKYLYILAICIGIIGTTVFLVERKNAADREKRLEEIKSDRHGIPNDVEVPPGLAFFDASLATNSREPYYESYGKTCLAREGTDFANTDRGLKAQDFLQFNDTTPRQHWIRFNLHRSRRPMNVNYQYFNSRNEPIGRFTFDWKDSLVMHTGQVPLQGMPSKLCGQITQNGKSFFFKRTYHWTYRAQQNEAFDVDDQCPIGKFPISSGPVTVGREREYLFDYENSVNDLVFLTSLDEC